jgi:hypothetical protein
MHCFAMRGSGAFRKPAKGSASAVLEVSEAKMLTRVATKSVKITLAVSLRVPASSQSAQGEPAPKARPKGVADGNHVNIRGPAG